ncbi:hypothetical protein EIP86_002914 [Pleurotus ostreatoroseus]|nr:hypothetical protein EIP86_002914 [Pleurotus ostreatoroseus]
MQGYHPQQPYYPQQPPYPQQAFQPSYPYPQYPVQPVVAPGQPIPSYQPFPNVYRAADQYEQAQPAPQQLAPRPKHLRRSQTTTTPNAKAAPLKSAMKKSHDRSVSMGGAGPITPDLSRTSSRATSEQRHRANSNASRHRANSVPPPIDGPGHIFVTFSGTNELRVENIPDEDLVEDFRQTIPFEWPHGLTNEEHHSHRWRVQFGGTPWSSSGVDAIR